MCFVVRLLSFCFQDKFIFDKIRVRRQAVVFSTLPPAEAIKNEPLLNRGLFLIASVRGYHFNKTSALDIFF